MQERQERHEAAGKALLSAHQVQRMLHVDRSTVYRMAEDGRLPAIKVGRQWRFPAARIEALVSGGATEAAREAGVIDISPAHAGPVAERPVDERPVDERVVERPVADSAPGVEVAAAVAQVAAELLGVMMVVTDMNGRPLIEVTNPCPWFEARLQDTELLETCTQEWQQLADDVDLEPRFHTGRLGFQCARAFVRSGSSLVGMVLAGGIAPEAGQTGDPDEADPAVAETREGLYRLNAKQRRKVLSALPKVAASLSRVQTRGSSAEVPGSGASAPIRTAPQAGATETPITERNEP